LFLIPASFGTGDVATASVPNNNMIKTVKKELLLDQGMLYWLVFQTII
jgi:hypothetical protein